MADSEAGTSSFHIGSVGAGARVQQGAGNSWSETSFHSIPGGDDLRRRFEEFVDRLTQSWEFDQETREFAREKALAVAESLDRAPEDPSALRRALLDARGWLGGTAAWAWDALKEIMASQPAQTLVSNITETGTKAAINALIGK